MITKGGILRQDFSLYDGVNKTASRRDSTGGTIQGFRIGGQVDVLGLYGSLSRRSILDAITHVGTNDATLLFTPGLWDIDDNLTISLPCYINAGAVFYVATGKTLTFSGPVVRESGTWTSGPGTVSYTPSNNVIAHQDDLASTDSGKGADLVANTLRAINVLDYGADPTGAADSTAAIQSAFTAQAAQDATLSSTAGPAAGYVPPVYFPAGVYLLNGAAITTTSPYSWVKGDQAILKKGASFSGSACFVNSASAWRMAFQGVQFFDFPIAIDLDSSNDNSGQIEIKNCGFFGSTVTAIRTDCRSTNVLVEDCMFRSNVHDWIMTSGDLCVLRGGWISQGTLEDDYDGAIVVEDIDGRFRIENVLLVPSVQTVTEPCWIKNYGVVMCRNQRFGGEAGSHTAVNNFSEGTATYQDDKVGVFIDACDLYIGSNQPAVRLFEIPNFVTIINNRGITGTGATLVDWSSTVDSGEQATAIAALSTSNILNIIEIHGNVVVEPYVPANLEFLTSSYKRIRAASTDGTAEIVIELVDTTVADDQVYGALSWVGNDVSSNANGRRAQLIVNGTGATGGVELVAKIAPAGSTTLADKYRVDDTGLILIPSASVTPAVNGDLVFEATSNTTITVKLKGSDGTVRSGTITLS